MSGATLVAYYDAYFLLGGILTPKQIGRLDYATLKWKKFGKLASNRTNFQAIFDGIKFVIVGGSGELYNEHCIVNENKITCTKQKEDMLLEMYVFPLLFFIDLEDE